MSLQSELEKNETEIPAALTTTNNYKLSCVKEICWICFLFQAPSPCKEDARLNNYKSDYTAFSMKCVKTSETHISLVAATCIWLLLEELHCNI